jgi:hypothetical protein
MAMTPDVIEDDQRRARRSSWNAALSQLPGFPAQQRPKLPEVSAGAARRVSSAIAEEEEGSEENEV